MKTAECVTPMHPDKICDRISDAILDACLEQDPMSRVAIETMGGHGIITITGELTTKAYINIREIAKRVSGYDYGVQVNVVQQSPFIAQGVDINGAGDQGIMVGYACKDNEDLIPNEEFFSRELCKFLYKKHPFDGKTQITLDDQGKIKTIVASFQKVSQKQLQNDIDEWRTFIDEDYFTDIVTVYTNPAGDWDLGGFEADTGLTGRKLAVDNYGPQIPIGGGCFSGKDATKVDRSGAYMARKIAVDLLKRYPNSYDCMVKIAYSIGLAEPVMVTSQMTFKGEESKLVSQIVSGYDLTPSGIIDCLQLRKPQFEKTAEWGHFGNGFIWDKKYGNIKKIKRDDSRKSNET